MSAHRINRLLKIARIIALQKLGEVDPQDKSELQNWLDSNKENHNLFIRLQRDENLSEKLQEFESFDTESSYFELSNIIDAGESKQNKHKFLPVYLRWAVAVALLFTSTLLAILFFSKPGIEHEQTMAELHPGTQKAILITSDHQEIVLGDDKKRIVEEATAILTDTSQILVYKESISGKLFSSPQEFNTVITPRGGEYELVLADGTRIRLNAGSKIHFPVTFRESQRIVELEGEAYFEVAHAKRKEFIVRTPYMDVRVYGTSFNVSAYADDASNHTTLVDGKVGVLMQNREFGLKPGEQFSFDRDSKMFEIKEVNAELYTAWTKGLFAFENEELEKILIKLSRWYDFDIDYESEELKRIAFTGDLERYDEIHTILEMISIASEIKFKVENRKIYVYNKL